MATNLVPNDTNGSATSPVFDQYVQEMSDVAIKSGATSPISTYDREQYRFWLGGKDIFVRDMDNGSTRRVSVSSSGAQTDLGSEAPSISADGRFVVFSSIATNLVAGDSGGPHPPSMTGLATGPLGQHIYIHDREADTTVRVSVDPSGRPGDGSSGEPKISGDGRYVVYVSDARNIVPSATDVFQTISFGVRRNSNGVELAPATQTTVGGHRIYVLDRKTGKTSYVPRTDETADVGALVLSADSGTLYFGAQSLGPRANFTFLRFDVSSLTTSVIESRSEPRIPMYPAPAVSADGTVVAMGTWTGAGGVEVRDFRAGSTVVRSGTSGRFKDDRQDSTSPSLSADGNVVAFLVRGNDKRSGSDSTDIYLITR